MRWWAGLARANQEGLNDGRLPWCMNMQWLADRVEFRAQTAILLAGDIGVICIFVLAGRAHHRADLLGAVPTIVQFAVGWMIAGVLVGAYSDRAVASWKYGLSVPIIGWVFGVGIAHGIRVGMSPRNGIAPSFVLVSLVVGGGLLVVWRGIAVGLFGDVE